MSRTISKKTAHQSDQAMYLFIVVLPGGITCPASNPDTPRCRADFPDKSTGRRPAPKTGHGKRSLGGAHPRDNARHTSGTRRRAGDPSIERRQSDRHSSLIVGNDSEDSYAGSAASWRKNNSNRKMQPIPY